MEGLDLSKEWEIIDKSKQIDENSSIEEIDEMLEKLTKLSNDMNNLQLGIKLYINAVYGATAAPFFIGYNPQIAEAITIQGQTTIHYASESLEKYFTKIWPIDKKVHKALGIKKPGIVTDAVTRYGDTDTVAYDAIVHTNHGKMTLEELFERSMNNSFGMTITPRGNEILMPNGVTVENFTKDGEIKQCKVRYLIRHKINKPKFEIKTKSGKSIKVSNDHSCIVFRDGVKLKVKAAEILPTDKILVIKKRDAVE